MNAPPPTAYIYGVQPRKEQNLGYCLLRATYPVLRLLFPNQMILSDGLGRAIVGVAASDTSGPRRAALTEDTARSCAG